MKISKCVSTRLKEILYNRNLSIGDLQDLTGQSKGTLTSLLYNRYNAVNMKTVFFNIASAKYYSNRVF